MRSLVTTAVVLIGLQISGPAFANYGGPGCSTSMLAGRWAFATGIGHQALSDAPAPSDITAIGTMNIRRNGDVEGVFDVTFEGLAFSPSVPYAGTLTVNEDCTGTLSFVTGSGAMRTDSLFVLSRYEIWGMSQDPNNLWTYRVRRLSGRLGFLHR